MTDFLQQYEICADLGISDETWMRWRKAGWVPMPADMPGRKKWRVEDIEEFKRTGIPRATEFRYFQSHRRAVR